LKKVTVPKLLKIGIYEASGDNVRKKKIGNELSRRDLYLSRKKGDTSIYHGVY